MRWAGDVNPISHLQFADDTLIFCETNEDQVKNVKAILICYEAVSGLKINFFKIELIGIRVDDPKMIQFADILGCRVRSLPTTYLGLPLCSRMADKTLWNPVVERMDQKADNVES